MRKTDLRAVKEVARTMLALEPHLTKFSPLVISHPFSNTGIVGIRKDGETHILNIAENRDNLREWRSCVKEQIDNSASPFDIYMMLNTPYALTFLKHTKPYLSREDHSKILASAWTSAEAPNQDVDVSKTQLLAMFKAADPAVLMDKDEYRQWGELEGQITVYRGVTPYNGKNVRALSWTLDRNTAEWFAHRFGEEGMVYEAQIEKEHIYALFNGRNESEVVVDPKHLTGIIESPEPEQHYELSM